MRQKRNLVELFTALGADDPESWARSETDEDIAQLARFRLIRLVAGEVNSWESPGNAWIENVRKGSSREAEAVQRALDAGLSPDDLGTIARLGAYEAAFRVLYLLGDSEEVDVTDDLREQLPGWKLVEMDSDGEPTGRDVGMLHEDLLTECERLHPSPGRPGG